MHTFSMVIEFQEHLTTHLELTKLFSDISLSNDSNKVSHKIVVNGNPYSATAKIVVPRKVAKGRNFAKNRFSVCFTDAHGSENNGKWWNLLAVWRLPPAI